MMPLQKVAGNKKGKLARGAEFPFFIRGKSLATLLCVNHSFFFDSCFLTGEAAQVVQFSTTYFTDFVHRDAVDGR